VLRALADELKQVDVQPQANQVAPPPLSVANG
jgi:hypothetical protein